MRAGVLEITRNPISWEQAALSAEVGHLGTRAFRHAYRSWLDAGGAPVAVQQKMMRHAGIGNEIQQLWW